MLINIPITIDDNLFEKTINQDYQNKVDQYLYSKVDGVLKDMDPSWSNKTAKRGLIQLVEDIIKEQVLGDWKDEIVSNAARLLASRIEKTKAAKELKGE